MQEGSPPGTQKDKKDKVQRSAISGKKLRLHVDKTAADLVSDAKRASLLEYLNGGEDDF